ncbi:Arc family DNA-binding protein [Acinetobacter bereziniae]|nr:Arc family DNA-binding protein [Acinetobacter bereziniae]
MSREDPQLKIRLPIELKDKITESASNLGRSINADVIARLESSFENQGKTSDQEVILLKERLNDVTGLLDSMRGLFSAIAVGKEKEFFAIMELRHPKAFEEARKNKNDASEEMSKTADDFLEKLKKTVLAENNTSDKPITKSDNEW